MSVQSPSFFDETSDSIRVLHVDDEPEFARLTAEFIQSAGNELTVHTAPTAQAGLERLEELRIDCVVSDFEMPGMNGLEFLEAVRDRGSALPFILMTGKESDEIVPRAIEAGVTDYLQKEIGKAQYTLLANRIRNAVEQHRVTRHRRATDLVIDINRALLQNETRDEIAEGVCQTICSHESYDFAWIGTTDSSGAWIEAQTVAGRTERDSSDRERASPAPDDALSAALETGEIQTTQLSTAPGPGSERDGNVPRTLAVVPAVRSEATHGVLCVSKERADEFDAMERSLFEWVAHDLAIALSSANDFKMRPSREVNRS